MAGQAKYMNKFYNTSYLTKTKKLIEITLQITTHINRTQKLSDLVNTGLTEQQYIKRQEKQILKPLTSVSNTLFFLIIRGISKVN